MPWILEHKNSKVVYVLLAREQLPVVALLVDIGVDQTMMSRVRVICMVSDFV